MILGNGLCFAELDDAVRALGGERDRPVAFNAHNVAPPDGAIVYNLENLDQVMPTSWLGHPIWDFSARNMGRYPGAMRDSVTHVPLGYHPSMTRFQMRPYAERDIDVIFCGAPHPRRQKIFDALRSFKLNVVHNTSIFGAERDALLARSKLALNLRYYPDGVYPTLRTMHCVANGVPVLSESAPEMPAWAAKLPHVAYDKLAEKAILFLRAKVPIDMAAVLAQFKKFPLKLPPSVSVESRPIQKMVVAVVVYNRFENIEKWIACWKQSVTRDAELVVVHNHYGNVQESARFRATCEAGGVTYVPRGSGGYDIGAFQDVCKKRLVGFPDYDALLWCTDDTFPMRKDFLLPFHSKLSTPGVGIACMQMSTEYADHVRTTGFCLRRETAERLYFPADPLLTKNQCYDFEHRAGQGTLYQQVRAMGLRAETVGPDATSPLWDSDFSRRLPRQHEHARAFALATLPTNQAARAPSLLTKAGAGPRGSKVAVICPLFDAFPEIISSMLCQTHQEWELVLIDDNPETTNAEAIVKATQDKRITYLRRPRADGALFGHPHRRWALQEIAAEKLAADADYVLITNADNYYMPPFLKKMVASFVDPSKVAAYCGTMVHSYVDWKVMPCRLKRGFLDCGGVVVRKDVACATGWPSYEHSSDWTYFSNILEKYGPNAWSKVPGALFVHN